MTRFWDDFPTIKYDLELVQEVILESVRSRSRTITEALSNLANRNGKLLRPGFVVLSARIRGDAETNRSGRDEPGVDSGGPGPNHKPALGEIGSADKNGSLRVELAFADVRERDRRPEPKALPQNIYRVAAAIELLHLATLIHDDVIDEADVRRGQPTLHREYGTKEAILMGDFLFSRCYRILADNASLENAKRLAIVVSQIVTGEIEQSVHGPETQSTPRAYLRRVVGKTATLVADSFYLGASEAGIGLAQTLLLRRIGYSIGMAFQIIDDILDFTGRADLLGKAPGSDLRQGVVTLPLIYAMREEAGEMIRRRVMHPESLTDAEMTDVIAQIDRCGGFAMAREKADLFTRRALRQIAVLPRGVNRDTLSEVTSRLLDRGY
ncbi:MAG TPA: polyprenyl synthetase family protein [Spirochaetia bacterium]|nr:polyprenyl synthetase family protein [Spirochaetia bacterium]